MGASVKSFPAAFVGAVVSKKVLPPSATPSKSGDVILVKMNEESYVEQLKFCKHSLIMRIILAKDEIMWKQNELKAKVTAIWKLISFGKGKF